jgi:hypothetical protein
MASSLLSRSRVEWARRSSLVTINQSPGDTRLQNRAPNYALINSKKEISAATRERSFTSYPHLLPRLAERRVRQAGGKRDACHFFERLCNATKSSTPNSPAAALSMPNAA